MTIETPAGALKLGKYRLTVGRGGADRRTYRGLLREAQHRGESVPGRYELEGSTTFESKRHDGERLVKVMVTEKGVYGIVPDQILEAKPL
jgi:hypothetical protein